MSVLPYALRAGSTERMSARLTEPFAAGGDVLGLSLTPGGTPDEAVVAGYDFRDHQARFGVTPDPAYVVRALADMNSPAVLRFRCVGVGIPAGTDVVVSVPGGVTAGWSAPVPLPPEAGPDARLTGLSLVGRVSGDLPAELGWSLGALLGTTARLLWVLAGERDGLRRQLARTAAARGLPGAGGGGLNLIGADLAVPRFPPLPYPYDPDTIALYHLDDDPVPGTVEDFTGRFPGRTGHPGTVSGAVVLGSVGRFGSGAQFTGTGSIRIAEVSDLGIPVDGDLTAECFVRPAGGAADGRVLGHRAGDGTGAGWTLEVGEFGRGRADSVRAVASDGTVTLELFADLSLPGDRFTHVGLVLDRVAGSLSLWLDGVQVALTQLGSLGALDPAVEFLIGPDGSGFRGWVDEVRLSSLARNGFHPVLGEADDVYRRRLALFRRWVLPTPGTLAQVLNDTVGPVGGVAGGLVVDDTDAPMVRGSTLVRVVPASLEAGESIDLSGRRGARPADLAPDGADAGFDPSFLVSHHNVNVDYGPASGPPAGDPHAMQLGLAADLDRFLALPEILAAPGRVRVVSAYVPAAPGATGPDGMVDDGTLIAVAEGRAVVLKHTSIGPARLAAVAHRSGFDLVTRLTGSAGVRVVCAPGRMVEITAADNPGALPVGAGLVLSVAPPLPPGAVPNWVVINGGPGRAGVVAHPDGTATLTGIAAGQVAVGLDVTLGVHTVTVTLPVAIQPVSVADGDAIAADGSLGATLDVVGPPDPDPDPALLLSLLVTHDDVRATYADPDCHLMQREVAARLDALLDLLTARGVAGQLKVVQAYQPAAGDPDLASCGRSLLLTHPTVDAGALTAAAHTAGFGYAAHTGTDTALAHPTAPLIAVTGPDLVEEGASVTLTVDPDPATVGPSIRLSWSSGGPTGGSGGLTSSTQPSVGLVGLRAGVVWVQATLREAGAAGPYCVQVRLQPALAAAGATLTREQYDLAMNALHALHPLGVEVLTRDLRAAVVELAGGTELDPDYTYPKFRLHRPAARLRRDSSR